MGDHDCKACGEPVTARSTACSSCGNHPRKDICKLLVGVGLLFAVGAVLFFPIVVFPVFAFLLAALFWVFGDRFYQPWKYDFDL